MTTLREAAQQALDYIRSTTDYKMGHPPACEAALYLADALAEPQPLTNREVMQQALGALNIATLGTLTGKWKLGEKAMKDLRAALAEPQGEMVAAWEDKYGMKEWEVHALRAGWRPAKEPDPCPQCNKGGVCRTPKCGRLKLPVDHQFRTAPQPKAEPQEPVAYWIPKAEQFCIAKPDGRPFAKAWQPLYAAPQPAKRVPLTDEEIKSIFENLFGYFMAPTLDDKRFARAVIEAYERKQGEQT